MRLKVLIECIPITGSIQGVFRLREVWQVLFETKGLCSSKKKMDGTYEWNPNPVLVYIILGPFVALFICLKIVPGVSSSVVHEQPPPAIVGEG